MPTSLAFPSRSLGFHKALSCTHLKFHHSSSFIIEPTVRAGKQFFSPGLRLDHSKRTLKTFSIYWQIDTKETFSAPNCSANKNCSKRKKTTKKSRRPARWRHWKQNGIGRVFKKKMRRSCSHGNGEWCVSQNKNKSRRLSLMCAYAVFSTKMERTTRTSSATIPKIQSYSRRNSLQFPVPPVQAHRRGEEGLAASLLSERGTFSAQRLLYFIRFAAKTKGVTQPDGHTKDKHL